MLKKDNEQLNVKYQEQAKRMAEEQRLSEEKDRRIQELSEALARAQTDIRNLHLLGQRPAQPQSPVQPPRPQNPPSSPPSNPPSSLPSNPPSSLPSNPPYSLPSNPPSSLPAPNPAMVQAQENFKAVVTTLVHMGFAKDDVLAAFQRIPPNTAQDQLVQVTLNELLGHSRM